MLKLTVGILHLSTVACFVLFLPLLFFLFVGFLCLYLWLPSSVFVFDCVPERWMHSALGKGQCHMYCNCIWTCFVIKAFSSPFRMIWEDMQWFSKRMLSSWIASVHTITSSISSMRIAHKFNWEQKLFLLDFGIWLLGKVGSFDCKRIAFAIVDYNI